jgi:hypothetical protein
MHFDKKIPTLIDFCNIVLERSHSIFVEWRIAHYHEF